MREDIPSKALKTSFSKQGIFIEINLKKRKWLIFGGYNPNKSFITEYLSELSTQMDILLGSYDNVLIMGDFNSELPEPSMAHFYSMYGLKNLINEPTCYKNPLNPTSIDLMLTNMHKLFQHSKVFDIGLSDFHKMTVTVMKMTYHKLKPKVISYRDYSRYCNENFKRDLTISLQQFHAQNIPYELFEKTLMIVLNLHAPIKQKYLRGNHQPFMNKSLSKAIMHRSKLRNIYIKNKTDINKRNYAKQRNFCVNLLRKVKRDYYSALNISNVTDNKTFWKTVKPGFTDKVNTNDQITLVERDTVISDNAQVADIMIHFFSNIVEILEISDNHDLIVNTGESENPVNKAITKYSKHPSIIKIRESGIKGIFSLCHTTEETVEKAIHPLILIKQRLKAACQQRY